MATKQAREFVLQRDYALSSTLGHRVVFKKGEPVFVPVEMERAAIGIGALPVVGDIPMPEEDQSAQRVVGPLSADKIDEIKKAITQLVEANHRTDFTAAGTPRTASLERVLGYPVDVKERDQALQQLRDEANDKAA